MTPFFHILLPLALNVALAGGQNPCKGPLPRSAPCKPGDSDIADIRKLVDIALKDRQTLLAYRDQEVEALLSADTGNPASVQAWRVANARSGIAQTRADTSLRMVLNRTAETYGVSFEGAGQRIPNRPYAGIERTWAPAVWLGDGDYYRTQGINNEGHALPAPSAGEDSAIRANGDVWISARVLLELDLDGDPAPLALLLAFEAKRFTGLLNGKRPTKIQSEALQAAIQASIAFGMPQQTTIQLTQEWQRFVNTGNSSRSLLEIPSPQAEVQYSNGWKKTFEAKRRRLQARIRRESQRRGALNDSPMGLTEAEFAEFNEEAWKEFDRVVAMLCDSQVPLPEALVEEWNQSIQDIPDLPAIVDYDAHPGTVRCESYLLDHLMATRRLGGDVAGRSALEDALQEAFRRMNDPTPRSFPNAAPALPQWPAPEPNPAPEPPLPPPSVQSPDLIERRPPPPLPGERCFGGGYNCGPIEGRRH